MGLCSDYFSVRPQFSLCWSNEEHASSPLVRSLTSRNTFLKVKSYLHVCDSGSIDGDEN